MPKEEKVTKKCPFHQQGEVWCDMKVCALAVEFRRIENGTPMRAMMCVFVGTNIILSEMNMKFQQQGKQPMPQIVIPGLGRG